MSRKFVVVVPMIKYSKMTSQRMLVSFLLSSLLDETQFTLEGHAPLSEQITWYQIYATCSWDAPYLLWKRMYMEVLVEIVLCL